MYILINFSVSILFFVLAYFIGTKEKIELIHDYHHKNVKEEDKKAYTALYSRGLRLIGFGLVATSVLEYFTKNDLYWIIYLFSFVSAFAIFHKAQMKYNDGKWFT